MSDIIPEQSQLFEKVVRFENQGVPPLALTHHYVFSFSLQMTCCSRTLQSTHFIRSHLKNALTFALLPKGWLCQTLPASSELLRVNRFLAHPE